MEIVKGGCYTNNRMVVEIVKISHLEDQALYHYYDMKGKLIHSGWTSVSFMKNWAKKRVKRGNS